MIREPDLHIHVHTEWIIRMLKKCLENYIIINIFSNPREIFKYLVPGKFKLPSKYVKNLIFFIQYISFKRLHLRDDVKFPLYKDTFTLAKKISCQRWEMSRRSLQHRYFSDISREIWMLMESRYFSSLMENNGENPAIIVCTQIHAIVHRTLKARKHVPLSLSLSSDYSFYLDALQ